MYNRYGQVHTNAVYELCVSVVCLRWRVCVYYIINILYSPCELLSITIFPTHLVSRRHTYCYSKRFSYYYIEKYAHGAINNVMSVRDNTPLERYHSINDDGCLKNQFLYYFTNIRLPSGCCGFFMYPIQHVPNNRIVTPPPSKNSVHKITIRINYTHCILYYLIIYKK